MNICIIINTPAQVHFYKNIISKLEADGHEIIILVRDYGETINLINEMGINYTKFNFSTNSPLNIILSFPLDLINIYKIVHNKKIDIFLGFGMYDVFASKLLNARSIVFLDSEPKSSPFLNIQFILFMPFVHSIITPASFRENLGNKHIKINSFKELSYLHPKYFTPNENIFELLDIPKFQDYIVMRFNNFDALHDLSIKGFSLIEKEHLINELKKITKIYVSFEGKIPPEFEEYKLKIPKNRIHDLLYYSKLLITDTGTMATEAAILGTPVIKKNPFGKNKNMGNFIDLEDKYKLIYTINDINEVLKKSKEIILNKNIKNIWLKKKNLFLNDKVDIVEYMTKYIESYSISTKK